MADLTETELSALEELEKAATAGPWQAHAHMVEAEAGADLIGECSDAYPLGNNNAELISAARNALPSLLAAARERDELVSERGTVEGRNPDGTSRLCQVLYGEEHARYYIGGSQARMLHDAADAIAERDELRRQVAIARAGAAQNLCLYYMTEKSSARAKGDHKSVKRWARSYRLVAHWWRKFEQEAIAATESKGEL